MTTSRTAMRSSCVFIATLMLWAAPFSRAFVLQQSTRSQRTNIVLVSPSFVSSSSQRHHHQYRTRSIVFSEPTDDQETPLSSLTTTNDAATRSEPQTTPTKTVAAATAAVEDGSSVPIDLPSPLLLAASIILGIVSTGSLFDLIGGNPTFGFAPTAAVCLLGVPLCFYVFYAAILKGQAETEEDDKKFGGGGF